MVKIEIRKNVPIPQPVNNKRNKTGTKFTYPWKKLEVGDCFIVEGSNPHKISRMIASRHINHHEKYTRRSIDGKEWVWRIA